MGKAVFLEKKTPKPLNHFISTILIGILSYGQNVKIAYSEFSTFVVIGLLPNCQSNPICSKEKCGDSFSAIEAPLSIT